MNTKLILVMNKRAKLKTNGNGVLRGFFITIFIISFLSFLKRLEGQCMPIGIMCVQVLVSL